jgi:hypothetical protein
MNAAFLGSIGTPDLSGRNSAGIERNLSVLPEKD